MRVRRALKKLLNFNKADLRCSWVVFAIACFLVVMLFTWSTAYKMSLYHMNGPELPHAKISAGDGPLKRGLTALAILVAAITPWLLAFTQRLNSRRIPRRELVPVRAIQATTNPSLYFRPPPVRR